MSCTTGSLASLCTQANLAALFSTFTDLPTVVYHTESISATIVSNYTNTPSASGPLWPAAHGVSFCNVTLSYSHINLNDNILNQFWLPDPSVYQNRLLCTGGGGFSVSGVASLGGGLSYGAVSAATDGGFGGWSSSLSPKILEAGGNGTIAWSAMESYAFLANHEMVTTGKQLATAFYKANSSALMAYYFGCSEGGREGLKAVQTYPDDYNGVIAAAPGINLPITQSIQGNPAWIMAGLNHFPSPCAIQAIQQDVIAACDLADGLKDGVVSRADLCTYNITSSIGTTYSNCTKGGAGAPTSGTVSELDAMVVATFYDGPVLSNGERVWWLYNLGVDWTQQAPTTWNNATQSFVGTGNNFFEAIYQMLFLQTTATPVINYTEITTDAVYTNISSLIQLIGGWTQSTWPDLTEFQAHGSKVITWHGEQDQLLPTMMSASYYESVRKHMFGSNSSYSQIQDFYRYFRVPGADHCGLNPSEPHGPFPQNAVGQLIDWVEKGVAPETLNGTTESGSSTQPTICMWPTAPFWNAQGNFSCELVEDLAEKFIKEPNAWKIGTLK